MINDLKILLIVKGYKVKDGCTTLNVNNETILKSQINNFKILDSLDIKINLNDNSYLVF